MRDAGHRGSWNCRPSLSHTVRESGLQTNAGSKRETSERARPLPVHSGTLERLASHWEVREPRDKRSARSRRARLNLSLEHEHGAVQRHVHLERLSLPLDSQAHSCETRHRSRARARSLSLDVASLRMTRILLGRRQLAVGVPLFTQVVRLRESRACPFRSPWRPGRPWPSRPQRAG